MKDQIKQEDTLVGKSSNYLKQENISIKKITQTPEILKYLCKS